MAKLPRKGNSSELLKKHTGTRRDNEVWARVVADAGGRTGMGTEINAELGPSCFRMWGFNGVEWGRYNGDITGICNIFCNMYDYVCMCKL